MILKPAEQRRSSYRGGGGVQLLAQLTLTIQRVSHLRDQARN